MPTTVWLLRLISVIVCAARGRCGTLSIRAVKACIEEPQMITCTEQGTFSGRGHQVTFYKDGTAQACTVDLRRTCTLNFPSDSNCGCVSDVGGVKTHRFVVPQAAAATWRCIRTAIGGQRVQSNDVVAEVTEGSLPRHLTLSLSYDKETHTLLCTGPTSMGTNILGIKRVDTGAVIINMDKKLTSVRMLVTEEDEDVKYICSIAGEGLNCNEVINGNFTVPGKNPHAAGTNKPDTSSGSSGVYWDSSCKTLVLPCVALAAFLWQ